VDAPLWNWLAVGMFKERYRLLRGVGRVILAAGLLGVGILAPAAEPTVTNIRAAQQQGTKIVDVWYDVSGVTTAAYVGLQISSNAGTSFAVPATTLSGDLGANVQPGRNKHIVWNAGTDWNNQISTTMRFRVAASNSPPAPDGFALIPTGSFEMGDSLDGDTNALPVHTVYVSAFYMAKYLVTKADWDVVQTWGLTHNYTDLSTGEGKAVNHPVQTITWYDIVKWCNARSEKEGLTPCYTLSGMVYRTTNNSAVVCDWSANGYRLPTEAEWEKAARGGLNGKRFPWGDTITHSKANYYSISTSSYDVSPTRGWHPTWGTGSFPYTSPVGSFAANGYGLYDMAGNLWEWCWDRDGSYTDGAQIDPRGVASGSYRVLRGGSWNHYASQTRCAFRNGDSPINAYMIFGFRVARSSIP